MSEQGGFNQHAGFCLVVEPGNLQCESGNHWADESGVMTETYSLSSHHSGFDGGKTTLNRVQKASRRAKIGVPPSCHILVQQTAQRRYYRNAPYISWALSGNLPLSPSR